MPCSLATPFSHYCVHARMQFNRFLNVRKERKDHNDAINTLVLHVLVLLNLFFTTWFYYSALIQLEI